MSDPTVLLTGATGFIGGATRLRLLQIYFSCRVLLLVRGETPEAAAAHVRQSISRFAELARLEPALGACEIICGDLTDPDSLADPPGRDDPMSSTWPETRSWQLRSWAT